MIFIITNCVESDIQNYTNNKRYKFMDKTTLALEYKTENKDISLSDFQDFHINNYIIQKLQSSLKNSKNDYLIYKIDDLTNQIVENLYNFIMNKFSHKIEEVKLILKENNKIKISLLPSDINVFMHEILCSE